MEQDVIVFSQVCTILTWLYNPLYQTLTSLLTLQTCPQSRGSHSPCRMPSRPTATSSNRPRTSSTHRLDTYRTPDNSQPPTVSLKSFYHSPLLAALFTGSKSKTKKQGTSSLVQLCSIEYLSITDLLFTHCSMAVVCSLQRLRGRHHLHQFHEHAPAGRIRGPGVSLR